MSGLSIKRNVLFNVIGGVWTIMLNLLAIRFQLHILGSEAYGLLSFGASLQLFFSLFELGLSTLLTREIAKDSANSRALIDSVSLIFWGVALALGAILFFAAEWLVTHWITLEHISADDAVFVVRLWAVALAFNHPMTFYVGLLAGLRRLDMANLVKAGVATAYLGGGIVLLLVTGSLSLYMIWNVATSLGGVIAYSVAARRLLPRTAQFGFRRAALQPLLRPIFQLNLIAWFSILYTQSDRVIISRLLPVRQLGYYTSAFAVVTGITVLQGFITSAFMPTLAADFGRGDLITMRARYRKLAGLLMYGIGLFAFACLFFGRDLLTLWTTPETADGAYRVLGLLALGSLLNASVAAAYILCVVTENIQLPTRVNVAAVWLYVPLLYILIGALGIEGAALTWVLLNLYYVIVLVTLVQRRILDDSTWTHQALLRVFTTGLVFVAGYALAQAVDHRLLRLSIYALSGIAYLVVGYAALDAETKSSLIMPLRSLTLRKAI